MAIQKHRIITKEIKPNSFLREAKRAPLGDTFAFPDELTNIEKCRPHRHGLIGFQESSDARWVSITGHPGPKPPVPPGAECFSFQRGFVFIRGNDLVTVLRTSETNRAWREKLIFRSLHPISRCHECVTGDIFVIDERNRIGRVKGHKSFGRKAIGRMVKVVNPAAPISMHGVDFLPDHPWEDARVVGTDIWTRHGLSFYRNGVRLCTFPQSNETVVWKNEQQWFIVFQSGADTVVVACREQNNEKELNETSAIRTVTRFYLAEDGRLLFEEPDPRWHLCQANSQIVLYDPETSELRIANQPGIIARLPFTRIEPHFVGVTLARAYTKNGRQIVDHVIIPLPQPR